MIAGHLHRAPLDSLRLGERNGHDGREHRTPTDVLHFPPAEREQRKAGRRTKRKAARHARGQRPKPKRRQSGSDEVERCRNQEQAEPDAEPAARERKRSAESQRKRRPDQPARPRSGFQELGGRQFLDRGQDVAACPIGPPAARAGDQPLLEILQLPGIVDQQGLAGAFRHADSQRTLLQGPPEQGRLQVPVAEDRRGRPQEPRVEQRDACPARLRVDSLESLVRFIVRNDRDRRLRLLGKLGDQLGGRGDPVPDQQDHRSGLEAAYRLLHIAYREDCQSVETQPLDRILERLRHALDDDDDRRSARRRRAAHLIFEQSPAGQRKERSNAAGIVLLIGPDQRSKRHCGSPFPALPFTSLSNRFLGRAKMVNCNAMNPNPQRAQAFPPAVEQDQPLELTRDQIAIQPAFDQDRWSESQAEHRGAGGRQVLGTGLLVLAALWLGFTAWSAGRALVGQPLSSPAFAQWIAVAAGPLALLGLTWLMFGRTRRKETERFTRSVVAMRSEAQSLEALLEVLSQRIGESRSELTMITQHLMQLGDDATGKLGGITREFDASSDRLVHYGQALDRAAETARSDIAVLLDDLPRAEATARALAEQIRTAGSESAGKTAELSQQVGALTERTREADELVAGATQRLAASLAQIESAGTSAASRVGEAQSNFSGVLDALLERTSVVLEDIRSGIDTQAAAVTALVHQASAGIGRAGAEASETLASNIERANTSLEGLSGRVAEQDRASQRMIAEIDRGLALIDERFTELASHGDERANHFLESLTRARAELDSIAAEAGTQDSAIGALAERTSAIRESIERLAGEIRDGVGVAIGEAQGGADRLTQAAQVVKPEIEWLREAAVEASERMSATAGQIGEQQDRFAALLATVDDGVGEAQSKIAELASVIAQAEREASTLSAETGPALVAALVQVKEAAGHAAARAREAIEAVIPQSAERLSDETRAALERVIRESVEERLREVENVAARAVESARTASDRLTQQMLTLGQSASALEQHMEQTSREQREKDSEAFARRVALLIDSMHSAAIDVGKILSDEIDDKAWDSYIKGNRGVFTRRAVRLLGGSETRAIRAHYEGDLEFQRSVNRYIHDFEAMLRRVLAERDGGMIAVTLMSSDMGKLYAALAQIERRR